MEKNLKRAREAYERYQEVKADRRKQIQREYRKLAAQAFEKELTTMRSEFVGTLRDAIEDGTTGADIRKVVLRSNDWGRWVEWRDLALADEGEGS